MTGHWRRCAVVVELLPLPVAHVQGSAQVHRRPGWLDRFGVPWPGRLFRARRRHRRRGRPPHLPGAMAARRTMTFRGLPAVWCASTRRECGRSRNRRAAMVRRPRHRRPRHSEVRGPVVPERCRPPSRATRSITCPHVRKPPRAHRRSAIDRIPTPQWLGRRFVTRHGADGPPIPVVRRKAVGAGPMRHNRRRVQGLHPGAAAGP